MLKKKLNYTWIIMTLILTSRLTAQENKSLDRGGMGYFMFGAAQMDIEDLNQQITGLGYSELSDQFISFGGGGHAIIGNLLFGGEGHALIGDNTSKGSLETSMAYGYGMFDVGYCVYNTGKFRVFPMVGIGGGGMTLDIEDTSLKPDFNSLLNDPKGSISLSAGGLLMDLSIGANMFIFLGEDEEGIGGLNVGLRAGYLFSPFSGDWKLNEMDVSGGPDMSLTGLYIRITFGGGGFEYE